MIIIVMSIFTPTAFGQGNYNFGARLIPNKIVENSEGVLQIYALKNGHMLPAQIENMVVTSLDSSVIKIVEVQKNNNDFITNVKIKAIQSGTATIAIAAPGFSAEDVLITVYGGKNNQAGLLIKTSPSDFNVNGPMIGYLSVELVDEDGNPTIANDDMTIKLSASKSNIVKLQNQEIHIKKGEYYAVGQFNVEKSGDALIHASTPGMQTVSSQISVKSSEPLTVKLYVYPETISSFSSSYAYAIVQLQDANGDPVIAKENIPVSVKITNDDTEDPINTSGEYPGIAVEDLEIKKGSYYGYAKIVTHAGLEGTYNINISTKDYLVSDSKQLKVVDLELLDDKYASLDTIPILATGQKELVGVMHLEDADGNPIAANKDVVVKINSSDENALSVEDTIIDDGFGAALVFGKVAYAIPDTLTLRLVTESDEDINPTITGPTKESIELVAESLLSKVHYNSDFPIIVYMKNTDGTNTYFTQDLDLSILPNEYVQVDSQKILKGESSVLLNAKSMKDGHAELSLDAGDYSTDVSIDSSSSIPTSVHLDHPQALLTNFLNVFVLQILNSQQLPVFADKDMEVRLISNDNSILSVPDKITMKKGDYYALFSADAHKSGSTVISVLSGDVPGASELEVNVEDLVPQIEIISPDGIGADKTFDATVSVKRYDEPLNGMPIKWNVNGADVQFIDSITDQNGQARVVLSAKSSDKINIEATVSGAIFDHVTVSKTINVLTSEPIQDNSKPFDVNGFDPLPIIIPAGIASGALFIKKKSLANLLKSNKLNN